MPARLHRHCGFARAHVAAVSRMLEGKSEQRYEVFNIGTGHPVSVLELVNTFEKVNGLKLNYKIAARRAGDVEAVWADTSKAEKVLGWRAERELSETLRSHGFGRSTSEEYNVFLRTVRVLYRKIWRGGEFCIFVG